MTAVLARAPSAPEPGRGVWLKDNIVTCDLPTTAGSRMLEGHLPSFDATVVTRLRQAGFAVAGKAAMDEFAIGSTGRECAFGPVDNPVAPGCLVGGSSSGCAALIATGEASAALGSDAGGSIRLPAAFTRTVGMRPTRGRVSRNGLVAMASSMDTIGPMGSDVGTVAALFRVIAGPDLDDATCDGPACGDVDLARDFAQGAPLRVGLLSVGPTESDVDGMAAIAATVRVLVRAGAAAVSVTAPDRRRQLAAYRVLADAEAWSNLARYDGFRHGPPYDGGTAAGWRAARTRIRTDRFGAEVRVRLVHGAWALESGEALAAAERHRRRIRAFYDRAFQRCDVLVEPACPSAPPSLAAAESPKVIADLDRFLVGTSLAGLPSLVLPVRTVRGGPRAVHLTAPAGADERLLAVAAFIERGLP